ADPDRGRLHARRHDHLRRPRHALPGREARRHLGLPRAQGAEPAPALRPVPDPGGAVRRRGRAPLPGLPDAPEPARARLHARGRPVPAGPELRAARARAAGRAPEDRRGPGCMTAQDGAARNGAMKHDVGLAALIVNYNTGSYAECCVESLLVEWARDGRAREKLQIVLVDNASPEPQQQYLARIEALGVKVI